MPTPQELTSALQGNNDPDAMVLLLMAEAGADLRKPHAVEFAFVATERPNAAAVADELNALGFEIELYEPDDENQNYTIVAKRVMVPDLVALNQLTVRFERLAKSCSTIYDGWGAEVVE